MAIDNGWLIGDPIGFGTLSSLIDVMNGVIMIVTHNERRATILLWFRVCMFTALVLVAGLNFGEKFIAPVVALSSVVFFPIAIFGLARALKIKYLEIVSVLIRPLLASLLMSMLLLEISTFFEHEIPLIRLGIDICSGILIYSFIIFILWILTKKPAGIEKLIFQSIYKKIVRI